jgi:hypothetical protein
MIAVFWLAMAAAQAPPFDMKNVQSLMKQHCATEWPDNFQMQEFCIQQQIKGMADFKAASESVGRPLDAALEKCVEEWTEHGVPNWQMIGFCSKQQADSYLRLHPSTERG